MMLGNFRTDRKGSPYMKKCKYHCDYSDGEYCHYREESGCVYNVKEIKLIKKHTFSLKRTMSSA